MSLLPDEVKTPEDYLEYLLTINQIPEEMKVKFRSGFKRIERKMTLEQKVCFVIGLIVWLGFWSWVGYKLGDIVFGVIFN